MVVKLTLARMLLHQNTLIFYLSLLKLSVVLGQVNCKDLLLQQKMFLYFAGEFQRSDLIHT